MQYLFSKKMQDKPMIERLAKPVTRRRIQIPATEWQFM